MFGLDCFAKKFPVDLVILWVDGSDPAFMNERACWARKENCENAASNHVARFVQNDELRYVLRSVEKNLPWVRYVWLVTNGQQPTWLNVQHKKLKLISHTDFMPPNCLPTFNSCAITISLYKIKELAEHFLLANDDTFIWRPTPKQFFFPAENQVNNFYKKATWINHPEGIYRNMLLYSQRLMSRRFPKTPAPLEPHHNINGYLKSVCKDAWKLFARELKHTQHTRFRGPAHLNGWIFQAVSLVIGKGHWVEVKKARWGRKRISGTWELGQNYEKYIQRENPRLVCLNDSESSTEQDRKRLRNFLERAFPEKSSFEK